MTHHIRNPLPWNPAARPAVLFFTSGACSGLICSADAGDPALETGLEIWGDPADRAADIIGHGPSGRADPNAVHAEKQNNRTDIEMNCCRIAGAVS